jgi:hypothetical protein
MYPYLAIPKPQGDVLDRDQHCSIWITFVQHRASRRPSLTSACSTARIRRPDCQTIFGASSSNKDFEGSFPCRGEHKVRPYTTAWMARAFLSGTNRLPRSQIPDPQHNKHRPRRIFSRFKIRVLDGVPKFQHNSRA